MTTHTRPPFAETRVGNLDFWLASPQQREERYFAQLRAAQPISWQPPAEGTNPFMESKEDGFWAVTGHPEIVAITKDPATFCNGQGTMYDDFPPEAYEAAGSILVLDAPRHMKVRSLVSLAFTPRRLATIRGRSLHKRRRSSATWPNVSPAEATSSNWSRRDCRCGRSARWSASLRSSEQI